MVEVQPVGWGEETLQHAEGGCRALYQHGGVLESSLILCDVCNGALSLCVWVPRPLSESQTVGSTDPRSPPGPPAGGGWSRGRRRPSRPDLAPSGQRSGWWKAAPSWVWGGWAAATELRGGGKEGSVSEGEAPPTHSVPAHLLWTSRRAVLETMPASFLAETVYQPASSFEAGWMIIHR